MDRDTRNLLQRATQAARRLLEEEYQQQLEGTFDILIDGTIAAEPGAHLDERQRLVRRKIVAAIEHHREQQHSENAAAVQAYLRESAFTTLNRFVALKMLEARQLVQECLSRGEQSAGFREFAGLAPGLNALPDHGYRLYIECLFDEIGREVRVLFHRLDSAALLWPRRTALTGLLEILNQPALAAVWVEDETIGWVYQYFNDEAERRAMRDASSAPRNSRELAVRNQFFTPRYVVCFLTDNTLGRLWYEMMRGQTALASQCEYLVRRPTEIFLKAGEDVPAEMASDEASASQEELLKQPVYIPHRPLKDPREIRLLDPACGSMHFGLYAFDLFEIIYDEAWEIAQSTDEALKSAPSFASFVSYVADFSDKAAFLREVPRLIIERNIHGIDIDPRATQIAGLALWLRAQKSWQQQGVRPAERPPIRKSNIACAEPMPGEPELLREFTAELEPPALRGLFEAVVGLMRFAGEAGSLLRIEDDIRAVIAEAKQRWRDRPRSEQTDLFPAAKDLAAQQSELTHDVSGITDEHFWDDEAEPRIYAALREYAARAASAEGYQRRLFAEDVERGFAFIDLCRREFDVALMNPPFGEAARASRDYLGSRYPRTKHDLYAAFVERGLAKLAPGGWLGAISSRTGFFLSSFQKWREEILLRNAHPALLADLGAGVLDSAMVETAAYVLEKSPTTRKMLCFRILAPEDKQNVLAGAVSDVGRGTGGGVTFSASPASFSAVPGSPFAYWITDKVRRVFSNFERFETDGRVARGGMKTQGDFRFLRLAWEQSSSRANDWVPLCKGGAFSKFYFNLYLAVKWTDGGKEPRAYYSHLAQDSSWGGFGRNEADYLRPGLTWPRRTNGLSFRALPQGCIFGDKGPAAFTASDDPKELLALLAIVNSTPFALLVALQLARVELAQSFEVGIIQRTPVPPLNEVDSTNLSDLAQRAWIEKRALDTIVSTSRAFIAPPLLCVLGETLAERATAWGMRMQAAEAMLAEIQAEIDCLAFRLYGLDDADRDALTASVTTESVGDIEAAGEVDAEEEATFVVDNPALVADLLGYTVGAAFGRFDVRYATGEKQAPAAPAPFAALPICPPGMLQDACDLPADEPPAGYPLLFPTNGVLVDDAGHADDLVARVREVFAVLWPETHEAIEHEARTLLGVRDLRDWLRRPTSFFADHLKRHSKSRRQAPLYWPVGTPSGGYTVWLYYPRLGPGTFYHVKELAQEKLRHEERRLTGLRQDAGPNPAASQRRELAEAESFVGELTLFLAELTRLAPLWRPDLNDGALLNAAPLWRLFTHRPWQTACRDAWEELTAGKYDWAHLAMHLWPERVVPKCASDRSLAIAHCLEADLWEPDEDGKWKPKKLAAAALDTLIAARTDAAVKSALADLLNAPGAATPTRTRRNRA